MGFWIKVLIAATSLLFITVTPSLADTKTKKETKKESKKGSKKGSKKEVKKTTAAAKKKKETKKKMSGKEMNFAFNGVGLKLRITKSATAAAGVEFKDVEKRDDQSAVLNFATPQFRDQQVSIVPVLLLTEFDGEETLKSDIRELGYASEVKMGDTGIPRQLPLPRGYLFFWTTPTMGSANYYYLQHPQEKNIAIRIGPVAGLVDKDFTIDWAGARWSK